MTDPNTLFWLNSFSLLYLLLTSVVLLRNRIEFTPLRKYAADLPEFPKISICIPARNEEMNIVKVLTSVCEQSYPNFEILVLDDNSSDNTAQLIDDVQNRFPNLVKTVEAKEKPEKWLGKPWACQQLADQADGEILLFLDADTRLYSGMLNQTAGAFDRYNLDMITVWPQQITESFWEKMIVPLIYYALLTLLPTIYVYRSPRWVPSFLKAKIAPLFAAACGQCIGFKKEAYKTIGGHQSVKNQVVEDVELAKEARRKGLTLRMFEGVGSISCRMYRSERDIFNGLRKNFFPGFDRSIPLFFSMGLLHLVVFVLPFVLLPYSIYVSQPALFFLSVSSVTIILLHRFILAIWFGWNPAYGFLHSISVFWFQRLGLVSVADHLTGKTVKWKGRDV